MNGSILEVEAQRRRWARYRRHQRLHREAGEDFALGGLGHHVENLTLRILFLPADPEADTVPLNGETQRWFKERRSAIPMLRGHQDRVALDALVHYEQHREDRGWGGYVAIHRHGGTEIGVGNLTYRDRETEVFPLLHSVGLAWALAGLQAEASEKWRTQQPYELTVAVRNVAGATVGAFANGWAEPGQGLWDYPTCLDSNVLIRRELRDPNDPEEIAVGVGDRLEQAFGTTHRRHLARRGEFEGRLDPRLLNS